MRPVTSKRIAFRALIVFSATTVLVGFFFGYYSTNKIRLNLFYSYMDLNGEIPEPINADSHWSTSFSSLFSIDIAPATDSACQSALNNDPYNAEPPNSPRPLHYRDCPMTSQLSTFSRDRVLRLDVDVGEVQVTTVDGSNPGHISMYPKKKIWITHTTPLRLQLPANTRYVQLHFIRNSTRNGRILLDEYHVEPREHIISFFTDKIQHSDSINQIDSSLYKHHRDENNVQRDNETRVVEQINEHWFDRFGERRPSISLMVMDGMTRFAFMRHMPRTRSLIESYWNYSRTTSNTDLINEDGRHTAFVFNNLGHFARRTVFNIMPLLTGLLYDAEDGFTRIKDTEMHPAAAYITNQLTDRGWATSYAMPGCNQKMAAWVFPQHIRYTHLAPHVIPVDNVTENVCLAAMNPTHDKNGEPHPGACAGDRPVTEWMLYWTKRLWQMNPNTPKFGYFHEQSGHRGFKRSNIVSVDNMVYNAIKDILRADPNTIVLVMGDHGQWAREQPMMSMLIPPHILRNRRGSAQILEQNQGRLLTLLDIRATLIALLDLEKVQVSTPRSPANTPYDLLKNVVPFDRTCSMGNVPEAECPCNDVYMQRVDDIKGNDTQNALRVALEFANTTPGMGSVCPLLTIDYNEDLISEIIMPQRQTLRVNFAVHQGGISERPRFLAVVTHVKHSNEWRVIEMIQLTMYKVFDDCRAPNTVARFCFCMK